MIDLEGSFNSAIRGLSSANLSRGTGSNDEAFGELPISIIQTNINSAIVY